jgi:hypothetical protein
MPSGIQCRPKPTTCVLSHSWFAFIQIYGIDNSGNTPLHLACGWDRVEVAEYLLDHNADPSIRSESFVLVYLCLLKCVLQIIRVKLLFNEPNNRRWLVCFIRGVSQNEAFYVCCPCMGASGALDYIYISNPFCMNLSILSNSLSLSS